MIHLAKKILNSIMGKGKVLCDDELVFVEISSGLHRQASFSIYKRNFC